MFEWDEIKYIGLILIIALLLIGYFRLEKWKRKKQKSFADAHLFKYLTHQDSIAKYWLKALLLLISLFFLTLAIMGPQKSNEVTEVKKQGIDIVFALDVSRSMDCQDITPSRMIKAKKIIADLTEEMTGDRVGLTVYAGNAQTVLGLTEDYAALQMQLASANSDMISLQGTNLSEAIERSLNVFEPNTGGDRAIIILTDGEDHEKNIEKALAKAKEMKINIITIGLGTEKGEKIPLTEGGFKLDNGTSVITKLDRNTLQIIANQANGAYIEASLANSKTIKGIRQAILKYKKAVKTTKDYTNYKLYYQWFAFAALLIVLLESLVSNRKNKWIQKIIKADE